MTSWLIRAAFDFCVKEFQRSSSLRRTERCFTHEPAASTLCEKADQGKGTADRTLTRPQQEPQWATDFARTRIDEPQGTTRGGRSAS